MNERTHDFSDFLFREAALLDDNDLGGWLALLDERIDYRVPVRTIREEGEFSESAYFYFEDRDSIEARVVRLLSDDAWCEHPRTRTRRMVSNVRVVNAESELVDIRSNLALFCWRGHDTTPVILTGERQDTLSSADGALKLYSRRVLLDSTVLGLQSLSVFL